ncbi:hypothetical protein [Enterovibrio baiacu]|uniref:hypothetical protein n=1 Tax=Enterovibrio baiacu TaxID=2491023 RepID=UPI00101112BC|nr:hypothetical protein [Enterovibrio baiacu]MBE1275692.1 hypothetical protein [Enterovibrio baiacu]
MTESVFVNIYRGVDCGELGKITVRTDGESDVKAGDQIGLSFHTNKLHFFDSKGLSAAYS